MISGKTIRPLIFKDGSTLSEGCVVNLHWPDPHEKPGLVQVVAGTKTFSLAAIRALRLVGLTITEQELEEAFSDGRCETPAGHSVEPDGVDHEGNPSWLRICGLI